MPATLCCIGPLRFGPFIPTKNSLTAAVTSTLGTGCNSVRAAAVSSSSSSSSAGRLLDRRTHWHKITLSQAGEKRPLGNFGWLIFFFFFASRGGGKKKRFFVLIVKENNFGELLMAPLCTFLKPLTPNPNLCFSQRRCETGLKERKEKNLFHTIEVFVEQLASVWL